MKTSLFASFAAAVLIATSVAAAPAAAQQGPGRPPFAQGPADYRGPGAYQQYDRGPRPDFRAPARRPVRGRGYYEAGPRDLNYGYGYDQRPAPQPRRPVAVAIQIQL